MKQIKLFDQSIDQKEFTAIKKTLKSHFWASGSSSGSVEIFEKSFQKYIKSKSCIAVNSGTAALHLALSAFDIKNKEVILPSYLLFLLLTQYFTMEAFQNLLILTQIQYALMIDS